MNWLFKNIFSQMLNKFIFGSCKKNNSGLLFNRLKEKKSSRQDKFEEYKILINAGLVDKAEALKNETYSKMQKQYDKVQSSSGNQLVIEARTANNYSAIWSKMTTFDLEIIDKDIETKKEKKLNEDLEFRKQGKATHKLRSAIYEANIKNSKEEILNVSDSKDLQYLLNLSIFRCTNEKEFEDMIRNETITYFNGDIGSSQLDEWVAKDVANWKENHIKFLEIKKMLFQRLNDCKEQIPLVIQSEKVFTNEDRFQKDTNDLLIKLNEASRLKKSS